MTTIAHREPVRVTGGVDTHKDVHVAAALDDVGRLLGPGSFPTSRRGYCQLLAWLRGFGEINAVGVEGSNSWGAGLNRFLAAREVTVVEVNRPNRQTRRRRGKSDTIDAEAAARAVLNGEATVVPKAANGPVEALRQLRIARSGAMKARTAAANQLHSLTDTAPDSIRSQLRGLTVKKMVTVAERWRPGDGFTPEAASKRAMKSVATRWRALDDEIHQLNSHIRRLLATIAPVLLAVYGVGPDTAGQLLITAGDNAHRLRNESSFAALCGASPIPASSGRTERHRLNRGGDRNANAALWTIVMVRIAAGHGPTKAYMARRAAEGMSATEIMRCLKRYVARELYPLLTAIAEPANAGGTTALTIAA